VTEAGFIGAPQIAPAKHHFEIDFILSSSARLLFCCPLALLISCNLDLVPTNVHAAPATRTLFACI
jgi:hypothetical protein